MQAYSHFSESPYPITLLSFSYDNAIHLFTDTDALFQLILECGGEIYRHIFLQRQYAKFHFTASFRQSPQSILEVATVPEIVIYEFSIHVKACHIAQITDVEQRIAAVYAFSDLSAYEGYVTICYTKD